MGSPIPAPTQHSSSRLRILPYFGASHDQQAGYSIVFRRKLVRLMSRAGSHLAMIDAVAVQLRYLLGEVRGGVGGTVVRGVMWTWRPAWCSDGVGTASHHVQDPYTGLFDRDL